VFPVRLATGRKISGEVFGQRVFWRCPASIGHVDAREIFAANLRSERMKRNLSQETLDISAI